MRVLLDTQILIYREDRAISNYSIGHLYRWLDKLKYSKIIHPLSLDELQKYKDEEKKKAMNIKLESYNLLKSIKEPTEDFLSKLSNYNNKGNDVVDNYLLYEVYLGRVDILITEDQKMLLKAKDLQIDDRVYSINAFISKVSTEHPNLIEYKVLSVKKEILGKIDVNDPFFDSFRDSYPGFNSWFYKKCDEEVYVSYGDKSLLGFLFLKIENENDIDPTINPNLPQSKKMKIRSFKVESSGFRLGERFMYIIFDNALKNRVEYIYVTLFDNKKEVETLKSLLEKWGFCYHGTKNDSELVLVKNMSKYNSSKNPRYNYPLIDTSKSKRFLPISAQYHTKLFPDSILTTEKPENIITDEPHQYAIQKVYISWAKNYMPKTDPGDIVLIYRMGKSNYRNFESTTTSVCIVQNIITSFSDKEDFLSHCENRSVFSKDELDSFWRKQKNNIVVIKLLYLKSLNKKVTLDSLRQMEIIGRNEGPRIFHVLNDSDFEKILEKSETSL
ncbi:MAG: PIN domain-containing protein [Candidatus Izemoplasmatales bacterium]